MIMSKKKSKKQTKSQSVSRATGIKHDSALLIKQDVQIEEFENESGIIPPKSKNTK